MTKHSKGDTFNKTDSSQLKFPKRNFSKETSDRQSSLDTHGNYPPAKIEEFLSSGIMDGIKPKAKASENKVTKMLSKALL